jgi:large subunit ribosomal protein L35Ae
MSESTTTVSRKCVIINYIRRADDQKNKFMAVKIQGVDSDKEAARFIGRWVIWQTASGKKLRGKIVKVHGKNGLVKVRFQKGLPGQAIGKEAELA